MLMMIIALNMAIIAIVRLAKVIMMNPMLTLLRQEEMPPIVVVVVVVVLPMFVNNWKPNWYYTCWKWAKRKQ